MPRNGWARRGATITFCVAVGTMAASTSLAPAANNALAPTTWERGADGQWHQVAAPIPGNKRTAQQTGDDPAPATGGATTTKTSSGTSATTTTAGSGRDI